MTHLCQDNGSEECGKGVDHAVILPEGTTAAKEAEDGKEGPKNAEDDGAVGPAFVKERQELEGHIQVNATGLHQHLGCLNMQPWRHNFALTWTKVRIVI